MSERKSKPLGMALVLFAAVIMTALFLWPTTGWLLRLQLSSQLLPQSGDTEAAARRVAEANPNVYSIQLARALTMPFPENDPSVSLIKIKRLREMTARFAGEPSLYAHILRYATQGQVGLHRAEQDELSAVPPARSPSPPKISDTESLAAFDRDAAEGERLDPDNAYFPFMRAAGLYEAHRDADAIEAVHRAGEKTRYEDYANSEFTASDNFYTLVNGPRGAIARTALVASLLYPHYASLRAVARMGVVSAVHAELGGNAEAGFAIRRDLMHIGTLMRVQSHSIIGALVGIAITAIPSARPGGAAAELSPENLTPAQRDQGRQAKREKYLGYLRTIGHGDEAAWVEKEWKSGETAKQITRKISEVGPFSIASLRTTTIWWFTSILTLTNAVGLLILGGAAALAAVVRPGRRLKLWRGLFTLVVIGVFAAWLVNVERGVTNWALAPVEMVQTVSNMEGESPDYSGMEAAARAIGMVLALAVPLLMVAVIGVISLKSKVPFATGLGRGLRGLALPAACTMLLIYSVLLVGTAANEVTLNAGLDAIAAHEGSYLASQTGQTWPGLTPQ